MVIEAIVLIMYLLVRAPFTLIPDLPAMPTNVTDFEDNFASYISGTSGFLNYLFTPVLLNAIWVMIATLVIFKYGYGVLLWILTKLPIGVNR